VITAGARPEQMAAQKEIDVRTGPPAAQQGLRASDNSHRNRAAVIHRLPQHRRSLGSLRDCRHWAHTSTDGLPRSETERQDKRRTSMNDPAAKVRVLYSVPEAMALLNLSRTQIYELIRTSAW
jgi:hypothetical protein